LNKKVTKLSSEQDGENRLLEAIFELGTKIESNMEIRILLAKNFLFEKISNRKNFLSNILIVEERNVARKKAFPIIINITNQVLMYLIIGWVTISENKSIGNFVMLLTLFNLLNNLSQGILYKFNIIIRDLNIVDELIEFLSIHPAKKQKKHFISDDDTLLELKNVSYTYPFSSKAALKNINLTLGKGKTIAIVGANGSGKSTLAKIISGLLSPTNGKIYINDKTNFSAVFQNYMSYKLSLGENVRIGDIDKHYNEECVLKLFDKLNLNIPYDLDTQLGAVYGGIDLSGGQWQKIAIARGLWKTHNAIIFDEPTSALDAKSELFLINKFLEMAKGKTKIIITHRLAATKKADSIIVIEKGEIIEIGNHELLMNKHNSSYREMFDSQAKWYSS
ncbi:ABC transporter ATP-binding protein, partial [Planococcus sp. Urea-trap-24]